MDYSMVTAESTTLTNHNHCRARDQLGEAVRSINEREREKVACLLTIAFGSLMGSGRENMPARPSEPATPGPDG
jgi:hypothetical protein